MKTRALLLAAVAVPIVVLAQVSANPGEVVETKTAKTDVNTGQRVSYINAAQCAGANANLEWNITGTSPITGDYKLYASTQDPATRTGTGQGFCDIERATTPTTVNAGPIGTATATSAVQNLAVPGSQIIEVVNAEGAKDTCSTTNEGKVFWVCSHLVTTGNNVKAAVGKFLLQVTAPDAPANVRASSGDGALLVSWDPPSNLNPDHYQITATPADNSGPPVVGGEVTATKDVRISGLTNGVAYNVSVVAFSIGGNPSQPGVSTTAVTPKPMDDYWDWYQRAGGTEPGGCATGSAGVFALAGVAALLALRRRTK